MSIYEFYHWIWRRKTARRALFNISVKNRVELKGIVLDIGSKGDASYYDILTHLNKKSFFTMDIFLGKGVSVLGNIIQTPFKDNSIETILCFNVIEHVYDYHSAFDEIYRILKKDGVLYGYLPFICQVHADPYDYWRFTSDCLKICLEKYHFSVIDIQPQGGPFLCSFDLTGSIFRNYSILRVIYVTPFLIAESILKNIRPQTGKLFPLGYFFIAKKRQLN